MSTCTHESLNVRAALSRMNPYEPSCEDMTSTELESWLVDVMCGDELGIYYKIPSATITHTESAFPEQLYQTYKKNYLGSYEPHQIDPAWARELEVATKLHVYQLAYNVCKE